MSLTNLVLLDGHVGKDPESRFLPDGTKLVNVSLATNDYYIDKATGERKQRTDWHNLTVGGPSVESFLAYVKEGTALKVSGQCRTRRYQDANNKDVYYHYVRVEQWRLGPKKQGDSKDVAGSDNPSAGANEDDIPI